MFNGVHQVWQNKFTGKPNYGFFITFEDGTSGTCGSEKQAYPIAVGTMVTYEVNAGSNGVNHISKIKKVELVENGGNGSKLYNDPAVVQRIAFSMCQAIARLHFYNAGVQPRSLDDLNTLASIYHQWVTSEVYEGDPHYRETISRRYYALQLAVECIPFSKLGITRKEQVIQSAESFLQPLKHIGNAAQG